MKFDLQKLILLATKAGEEILKVYHSEDFQVEYKEDRSPLTKADKASNEILSKGLHQLYPQVPIISEEGRDVPLEKRKNWELFWLVDPLDGTKEFIKRNGDFTVNIALIEHGHPVLGVIYAPVWKTLYYANLEFGAFKQVNGEKPEPIHTNSEKMDNFVLVKSRSHSSSKDLDFMEKYSISDSISRGSSLKFCLVADSSADIYVRSGPTWEWDTAAGHAIVVSAGGKVTVDGRDLTYNKPSLKNDNGFVCVGNEKIFV